MLAARRRLLFGTGLLGGGLSRGAALRPLPVTPASVWGTRLMVATYAGPLARIRRSSDNAELDFYPGPDGWLPVNAILAFIGSGTGAFTTLYDQAGNSRTASQATAGNQPTFSTVNGRAVITYASGQNFTVANSAAVIRNVPGFTELVALQATTITGSFRAIIDYRNNSTAPRAAMYVNNSNFNVGGRRLDANAYASQEVAANANWNRLMGRFRYSAALLDTILNGTTTTLNPFQTAGNTSDTDSGSGPFIGGTYIGLMTALAVYSRALSDAEVVQADIALARAIP
jgi:hypothetical protein